MKKILKVLLLLPALISAESISLEKWKLEVDKGGRVVVYYENMPVNVIESPFTTYISVKIDDSVYNLGEDISAASITTSKEGITVVYKISSELMIEFNAYFAENPLVYDDIGVKFIIRVTTNFSRPTNFSLKYLFNPYTTEENKIGFAYTEDKIETPIYEEDEKNTPNNLIFYPFFFNFTTTPTYTFLSSWRRQKEEFKPDLKKLLSFRDIKTGKWDPAVGIFYDLGKIKDSTNKIEFFLGKWRKPNRFYPRIKILYPNTIKPDDKQIKIPLLINNNGDFDIDYLKITLSSPQLRSDLAGTINNFKKGQKKELVLSSMQELKENIKGNILGRMFLGNDVYEQEFLFEIEIEREKEIKKDLKEAENRINDINKIIDNINILLYFINIGIETRNYITADKVLKASYEFRKNIKKDK